MTAQETYINIDKVAELKGLKSNRSLRVEINKEKSKYKARKIKTQGGYTYEILFSTLESEIQALPLHILPKFYTTVCKFSIKFVLSLIN